MVEFISSAAVAKTIGGTWFTRELFSFFLKLRQQDQDRFYKPEAEWKQFCIQKFKTLEEQLGKILTHHGIQGG